MLWTHKHAQAITLDGIQCLMRTSVPMSSTAAPVGVDGQCVVELVKVSIAAGRTEASEGPRFEIAPPQYPNISESPQRSL